jgi:hypothetical protein
LSRATWLVATFAPRLGDKIGVHAIPGGGTKRLLELIGRLQAKLRGKGVSRVRTVCCYEAGYDGFWLHRVLVNHGIENHVRPVLQPRRPPPAPSECSSALPRPICALAQLSGTRSRVHSSSAAR